jgi:ribosomal protection tetracycline resistance protein
VKIEVYDKGTISIGPGMPPCHLAKRLRQMVHSTDSTTEASTISSTTIARVRGTPPARPRTEHNPLDRKEYLLHVARRV